IMGLLAFPHIMYTLSETTTLGIVFSRKTHYNIFVSIMSLVVSVIINLSLTPFIGFRGAALASTAAYVVFYLARTYFSSRTGFYFGQKKQIITIDRKSTRLNSSHVSISYAVFCLKKKKQIIETNHLLLI